MCCLLEQRALAWEKFKIKHEMKISKCFDQDRVTNTHILQIVTNGSLKSNRPTSLKRQLSPKHRAFNLLLKFYYRPFKIEGWSILGSFSLDAKNSLIKGDQDHYSSYWMQWVQAETAMNHTQVQPDRRTLPALLYKLDIAFKTQNIG